MNPYDVISKEDRRVYHSCQRRFAEMGDDATVQQQLRNLSPWVSNDLGIAATEARNAINRLQCCGLIEKREDQEEEKDPSDAEISEIEDRIAKMRRQVARREKERLNASPDLRNQVRIPRRYRSMTYRPLAPFSLECDFGQSSETFRSTSAKED